MNKDQTVALVTGIFKVIGTAVAMHGAQGAAAAAALNDPATIEAVAGLVVTVASFYASHKYNKTG